MWLTTITLREAAAAAELRVAGSPSMWVVVISDLPEIERFLKATTA